MLWAIVTPKLVQLYTYFWKLVLITIANCELTEDFWKHLVRRLSSVPFHQKSYMFTLFSKKKNCKTLNSLLKVNSDNNCSIVNWLKTFKYSLTKKFSKIIRNVTSYNSTKSGTTLHFLLEVSFDNNYVIMNWLRTFK